VTTQLQLTYLSYSDYTPSKETKNPAKLSK